MQGASEASAVRLWVSRVGRGALKCSPSHDAAWSKWGSNRRFCLEPRWAPQPQVLEGGNPFPLPSAPPPCILTKLSQAVFILFVLVEGLRGERQRPWSPLQAFWLRPQGARVLPKPRATVRCRDRSGDSYSCGQARSTLSLSMDRLCSLGESNRGVFLPHLGT